MRPSSAMLPRKLHPTIGDGSLSLKDRVFNELLRAAPIHFIGKPWSITVDSGTSSVVDGVLADVLKRPPCIVASEAPSSTNIAFLFTFGLL